MKYILSILLLLTVCTSFAQIKVIKVQGIPAQIDTSHLRLDINKKIETVTLIKTVDATDSVHTITQEAKGIETQVGIIRTPLPIDFDAVSPVRFDSIGPRHIRISINASTDASFSNASDDSVPTSKAVKDYVLANVGGGASIDTTSLSDRINLKVSTAVANATFATIGSSYTKSQADVLLGGKQDALMVSNNYLVRKYVGGFMNSSIQDNGNSVGIMVAPSVYSNLSVKMLLFTVSNKNKGYVLISDTTGNFRVMNQDSVWNGSAWIAADNTGWGKNALFNNTGINGSALGYYAGYNNTGNSFAATGYQALYSNTGVYATANGFQAGKNNTGAFVVFNGSISGVNNTGAHVNATGYFSAGNNTGDNSNGYGDFTLNNNKGVSANMFGHTSGQNNTGNFALGFGDGVMLNNVGDSSIGVGVPALKNNNSKNRIVIGNTTKYNNISLDASVRNFASANVTGTSITITAHGFGANGAKVNLLYTVLTGTTLGGLATGNMYQFTITNANTLTLSTITNAGSGTFTLSKDVDKSNSIVIGNNMDNTKANQTVIGGLGNTEVKLNGAAVIDSFQNKRLVFIGDSFSTLDKWPAYLNDSMPALSKYNKVGYAIPGQYTDSMVYYYPTTARLSKPKTGDDFWLFTYAGINDINNSKSADSTYVRLKWLWANGRSDGYKVVAFTIIKSLSLSAPAEIERQKLNNLILSDASLYDYAIDQANVFNPSIDVSVFSDNTHLNDAGWKIFAGTIARTINHVPYTLTTTQPISATYPISKVPTSFNATFPNSIILKGYTVATLPIGVIGMTAYVTDAASPTWGATLTGGGTTVAKAFFNGTNWVCQ